MGGENFGHQKTQVSRPCSKNGSEIEHGREPHGQIGARGSPARGAKIFSGGIAVVSARHGPAFFLRFSSPLFVNRRHGIGAVGGDCRQKILTDTSTTAPLFVKDSARPSYYTFTAPIICDDNDVFRWCVARSASFLDDLLRAIGLPSRKTSLPAMRRAAFSFTSDNHE